MPWHLAIDRRGAPVRQAPIGTRAAASARPTPTRRCGSASVCRMCSTRRSSARRSRSRSPRRTSGSRRVRGDSVRPRGRRRHYAGYALRLRPYSRGHSLLVDEALRARATGSFRGRAGAPRSRPRHVSLRHVVEPGRLRAATGIGIGPNRLDEIRRRREGVRHPRRRGALPQPDRVARCRSGCASSAGSSEP